MLTPNLYFSDASRAVTRGLARSAVALMLFVASATCSASEPAGADAGQVFRVPVTVETGQGPVTFQSELADNVEERTQGLMFRERMDDTHGMLFLFPFEQQLSFWMKNTLIPLDLIFIRSDRTILGVVENAEPQTLTRRMVPGRSQFVLEINGGLSSKKGIQAGQKVTFLAPIPDS